MLRIKYTVFFLVLVALVNITVPKIYAKKENKTTVAKNSQTVDAKVKIIENEKEEPSYNVNQYGIIQEELINAATPVPLITGDKELDDAVSEILAETTNDMMSNYEKIIMTYLYIEQNYRYKYSRAKTTVEYVSDYDKFIVEHAKGMTVYGCGDCANFTALFVVCARAIGLECYSIEGEYKGSGHYWAEIVLDGTRYIFDPEADFRASENRGTIRLLYFCINEESDMFDNYYPYHEQKDIDSFNKFFTRSPADTSASDNSETH